MNKEDKELLLKDLCSRLPYQPKLQIYYEEMSGSGVFDEELWEIDGDGQYCNGGRRLEDIKPYLRPMSSMTEKERNEYNRFVFTRYHEWDGHSKHTEYVELEDVNKYFEFLNSHHFDYRELIEKGLAIEVTKENNPYENRL